MCRKRNALLMIGGICVLCVLVLANMWKCPVYSIFGVPCPCCGVTRAWIAFLKGELLLAFRYHGLFPLIPVFLVCAVWRMLDIPRKKRWLDICLYVCAIGIFVYGFLRWIGVVTMP